ncbi:hypothetical protein M885DRAFT_519511 [Pelagophyceae sp. CCMP2097]|nr:hypothetical protein M885DRAFT_519511 [Pelagophyceae sp. CCMP2097]
MTTVSERPCRTHNFATGPLSFEIVPRGGVGRGASGAAGGWSIPKGPFCDLVARVVCEETRRDFEARVGPRAPSQQARPPGRRDGRVVSGSVPRGRCQGERREDSADGIPCFFGRRVADPVSAGTFARGGFSKSGPRLGPLQRMNPVVGTSSKVPKASRGPRGDESRGSVSRGRGNGGLVSRRPFPKKGPAFKGLPAFKGPLPNATLAFEVSSKGNGRMQLPKSRHRLETTPLGGRARRV